MPTIAADAARTIDPVVRDVRTPLDAVKARIPFLSLTVPAQRTIFGEEIKRDYGPAARLLNPLNTRRDKTEDPRVAELLFAGMTPTRRRRRPNEDPVLFQQRVVREGSLFGAEVDNLMRGKEVTLEDAGGNLVTVPYTSLPPAFRLRVLTRTLSQIRRQVVEEIGPR